MKQLAVLLLAGVTVAAAEHDGQRRVDAMIARRPAGMSDAQYRLALDRVCRQKDCYASKLFWFTDLTEAKAEARRSGKPILSLHLLGNLDEELSCANSRFFRTTLYSDPKIAGYMRQHFVLHWTSVRSVPIVTVDYGKGRQLKQTITGNSIHYLLDADGNPIDALPGLYSPAAFLRNLEAMSAFAADYAARPSKQRKSFAQRHHFNEWRKAANTLGLELWRQRKPNGTTKPTAKDAARLATTKIAGELPVLSQFNLQDEPIRDVEWDRFAETRLSLEPVEFAPQAIQLIREKAGAGADFDRMLKNLQRSVAEDTLRNEYDLRMQLHQWLAQEIPPLEKLNHRVYAELFLTPPDDPWLGLLQADRFVAIPDSGVRFER